MREKLTLTERLTIESDRIADEIYRNPTKEDKAAAKVMVLRGAEIVLEYIKEIGLVGIPTKP